LTSSKRITLTDVAKLARVDKSVVSRVINDDDRLVIKPETRDRVLVHLGHDTSPMIVISSRRVEIVIRW